MVALVHFARPRRPLEALRAIVSHAAARQPEDENHTGKGRLTHIMVNDVRRAYFYAPAQRDLYTELPAGDRLVHRGLLGKLRLSLYGTGDAASNWQDVLIEHLVPNGFVRGTGYPCCYHHSGRSLWTMVHGDDYVTSGYDTDLRWLQGKFEGAYELKTQHIGPCASGFSEGNVLNRVIRWGNGVLQLEADPRHAGLIVEQLGLDSSKGLSSLGVNDDDKPEAGDEELLFDYSSQACTTFSVPRMAHSNWYQR